MESSTCLIFTLLSKKRSGSLNLNRLAREREITAIVNNIYSRRALAHGRYQTTDAVFGILNVLSGVLGILGLIFGIYSLYLQIKDRTKINPKILQVFVRITSNLDYLIQVVISNLGNRVAENCMARIYEEDNSLTDLSYMPIDSPLGRISPDWPSESVFNVFPKTQITVRGYLQSQLQGHRVHIRLIHNYNEVDRKSFTLPPPTTIQRESIPIERPPERVLTAAVPEPAYPSDEWEFLWFRYTGDNSNPWGEFIRRTIKYDINFDEDWSDGEVDGTGQYDMVGLRASRTIRLLEEGLRRFIIGGDDGIRLFVSRESEEILQITESWRDQPYTINSIQVDLQEGEYKILLEWYENLGAARASFKIIRVPE